jgi:hypothetical protein
MPASTPALTADHSAPADTKFQDLEHRSGRAPPVARRTTVNQPDMSGYDRGARSAKVLGTMLRGQWSNLRCGGRISHPNFLHDATSTGDTARGPGVSEVDGCERGILVCTRSRVACETCPRFQANRERLAAPCLARRGNQLALSGSGPTDLFDRDGEGAQVDDLDAGRDTVRHAAVDRSQSQFHAVGIPGAPCVEDTEDGADHRDREGSGLDDGGVHRAAILAGSGCGQTRTSPDLSGYDRNVRSAKVLAGTQRASAAARPIDDAVHEAHNRFHDRNATPFTEMEKWFVRMVIAGVIAVFVCVVMLVRS